MASASSTTSNLSRESHTTPAIFVLMPTYNGERFLRPAIESILNQTFPNFELIIIDDGSTDNTPRILAEFNDNRLTVLTNQQNLGIAAATNRGLAAARGEYIALQDHDDISLPHRFQTQLNFLNTHPEIALVGSAATLIDENGVAYAEFPLPCEEIDIKWRLLFVGDAFHYTSIMVRRNAMQEIGGYGEDPAFRYSEAYDPFSRLAMGSRMVNLPDKLVLWRRHSAATSVQHTPEQIRSGEIISLRNISLVANHTHDGAHHKDVQYLLTGFKAFSSTPAGQLPTLPAEQVLSGADFLCDVQENFYRLHRFPRPVVARHRKPLNWIWGKHAIGLALRSSWNWRARTHSFVFGVRRLWDAASATVVSFIDRSLAKGRPLLSVTVPTIRPLPDPPEHSNLGRSAIKRAIKTSPLVRRATRSLMIPAVRAYLRYAPVALGKKTCWSIVLRHFLGLEPPEWDFTVRTVFSSKVCANTRDTVGKYIYYFGVWEPNLTHWIRRRLRPGDVFIDIGANLGYFSLLASQLVGDSGKVVAVEALPAIYAALQQNLKINNAHNVRPVNCAAWDAEEEITIYTQPEDLPGQTTVMPAWASKWHLENTSRILAAPLSAILKPEEFSAARLIKIDVEGAEWHAMAGMKPLMPSCRDDLEIMLEVNSKMLEVDGRTPQDVLDLFEGYGFHAYRIENDYLLERYLYREPPRAPRRIQRIQCEQADVIFSRIDAESL